MEYQNWRKPWSILIAIALCATALRAATPDPTNSPPLSSWSFENVESWDSDAGYSPLSWTNITSFQTNGINCLIVDSTNNAYLSYNVVENYGTTNAFTNITVDAGSILFWVAPSWVGTNQGGPGPGQWGRLIEIGSSTTNSSYGWWSLCHDPSGNVFFCAQTNNGAPTTTYLTTPVAWNTNNGGWIHLALTYSPSNSALYVNGSPVITNGSGVTVYPGTNVLSKGFFIGSSTNGDTQSHAAFASLFTYNYPLSASDISGFYTLYSILTAPVPITDITNAPSTVVTNPVFKAITGAGYLTYLSNSVSCATNTAVYLTNLTAKLVSSNSVTVTFAIAGGSNAVSYDVFGTSALQIPFTNAIWAWLGQGENCKFYSITNLPSTGAFLVLGTPDDPDSDGLTSAYEALITHTSPTNSDTDADGVSDGWEIVYGTDPNTIDFSLSPESRYTTNSTGAVQVSVTKGIPSKAAVLVDSTNFISAAWGDYANTLSANLGPTDGWHTIWVGLRGWPEHSQQTWESTRIKLDTVPPLLLITNPTTATVSRPVIQIQGYSVQSLSSLSYDITNASGLVTNALLFVLDDQFDTNIFEVTTNYFQAFDVALTNGDNTITIRASDLAGNTSTTNIALTVSYASRTNAPVVKLGWPQNTTRVGSNAFTWRGSLDDPTSTIYVQSVDTNGVTNTFSGRVGRDGDFWVENIPLGSGTNNLTLITTDVAGNSSSTNCSVISSPVTLTIDDYPSFTLVSGTISTNGYTVWVNGVEADQYDGSWSAFLELTLDDTVLQVRAIPSSDNGGNGSGGASPGGAGTNRPPDSEYQGNPTSSGATDAEVPLEWPGGLVYINDYRVNAYETVPIWDSNWFIVRDNFQWAEKKGGSGEVSFFWHAPDGEVTGYDDQTTWAAGRYEFMPAGTTVSLIDGSTNNVWDPPGGANYQNFADVSYTSPTGDTVYNNNEQAELTMWTGGKPGDTQSRFIAMSGGAGYSPPEMVQIAALGKLDTNGNLTLPFPPRTQVRVTPRIYNTNHYAFGVNGVLVSPVSQTISLVPSDRARTNIGVGEEVNLSFDAPLNLGSAMSWIKTAGGLSQVLGEATKFTAPSNAGPVTVRAVALGTSQPFQFMVYAPTGVANATITSTTGQIIDTNVAGAWMHLNVLVGPTNVSFYRAQILEVGMDATNISDYFTNHAPFSHKGNGADVWKTLNQDNSVNDFDTASMWGNSMLPPPWSPGGHFNWPVPARWKVGAGATNSMTGWNQNFSLDPNGTLTISKFGTNVIRTTNNVITPRL